MQSHLHPTSSLLCVMVVVFVDFRNTRFSIRSVRSTIQMKRYSLAFDVFQVARSDKANEGKNTTPMSLLTNSFSHVILLLSSCCVFKCAYSTRTYVVVEEYRAIILARQVST